MTRGPVLAILPAHNEEGAIAGVIGEILALHPDFDVVVVDDGSTDRTSEAAGAAGAAVVTLPFNVGIGGAVQTGFRYARDNGYVRAVRLDGDGQHDPADIGRLLEPVDQGVADVVTGSRFVSSERTYRPPFARRVGIVWFARLVSVLIRRRVTDTTSGFQALNADGIALFAADYPHDYPEVEATVMVWKHGLRAVEVPVVMREREHGTSSITLIRSLYYMIKVTLALLIAMVRKPAPVGAEA